MSRKNFWITDGMLIGDNCCYLMRCPANHCILFTKELPGVQGLAHLTKSRVGATAPLAVSTFATSGKSTFMRYCSILHIESLRFL